MDTAKQLAVLIILPATPVSILHSFSSPPHVPLLCTQSQPDNHGVYIVSVVGGHNDQSVSAIYQYDLCCMTIAVSGSIVHFQGLESSIILHNSD